jgi:hypothetical protein
LIHSGECCRLAQTVIGSGLSIRYETTPAKHLTRCAATFLQRLVRLLKWRIVCTIVCQRSSQGGKAAVKLSDPFEKHSQSRLGFKKFEDRPWHEDSTSAVDVEDILEHTQIRNKVEKVQKLSHLLRRPEAIVTCR